MRYTIARLDPNQSLEYIRPESLDEIPTSVEPYFKDHKARSSKESEPEIHGKENDIIDEETE